MDWDTANESAGCSLSHLLWCTGLKRLDSDITVLWTTYACSHHPTSAWLGLALGAASYHLPKRPHAPPTYPVVVGSAAGAVCGGLSAVVLHNVHHNCQTVCAGTTADCQHRDRISSTRHHAQVYTITAAVPISPSLTSMLTTWVSLIHKIISMDRPTQHTPNHIALVFLLLKVCASVAVFDMENNCAMCSFAKPPGSGLTTTDWLTSWLTWMKKLSRLDIYPPKMKLPVLTRGFILTVAPVLTAIIVLLLLLHDVSYTHADVMEDAAGTDHFWGEERSDFKRSQRRGSQS
ncbi:hypothetical protein JOB18_046942 [Solea senegalensis]|uniref:Uncharacterized protein n=1 Tax=Solea senegalensis TaxID=28829 RepID=A0AAV6S383_SOLSE|nr:hypothetical protein JOB18_046942 [Solea senegalensis]